MSAQHTGPAYPAVELLPCPFCGLAGRWFRTGRDVGVECTDGPDCPGRAQTNVYAPEHAVHAAGCWNSRADQAADHYADVLASREELLVALRDWFNDYAETRKGGEDDELVRRSRAAIAKAQGSAS